MRFVLETYCATPCLSETQKKKQNQDDSDEYDEDDEPGPSFHQPAAAQPQTGYIPHMTQPGMPSGSGAAGMPPGCYSGVKQLLYFNCNSCNLANPK